MKLDPHIVYEKFEPCGCGVIKRHTPYEGSMMLRYIQNIMCAKHKHKEEENRKKIALERAEQRKKSTALDLLYSIFSVEKEAEQYIFTEKCDGHFSETLSKDEVKRLIKELQALIK